MASKPSQQPAASQHQPSPSHTKPRAASRDVAFLLLSFPPPHSLKAHRHLATLPASFQLGNANRCRCERVSSSLLLLHFYSIVFPTDASPSCRAVSPESLAPMWPHHHQNSKAILPLCASYPVLQQSLKLWNLARTSATRFLLVLVAIEMLETTMLTHFPCLQYDFSTSSSHSWPFCQRCSSPRPRSPSTKS